MDTAEMLKLKKEFTDLAIAAMREGYLDVQFTEILKLGKFGIQLIQEFLYDRMDRLDGLHQLEDEIRNVDFKKWTNVAVSFLKSSARIGAARVRGAAFMLVSSCEAKDAPRCHMHLRWLRMEYIAVLQRLEALSGMGSRILVKGGSIPTVRPIPVLKSAL